MVSKLLNCYPHSRTQSFFIIFNFFFCFKVNYNDQICEKLYSHQTLWTMLCKLQRPDWSVFQTTLAHVTPFTLLAYNLWPLTVRSTIFALLPTFRWPDQSVVHHQNNLFSLYTETRSVDWPDISIEVKSGLDWRTFVDYLDVLWLCNTVKRSWIW